MPSTRKTQAHKNREGTKRQVSALRRNTDKRKSGVIALAVSDLHISNRPPTARSAEPDWYEAMQRPLATLRKYQRELSYKDQLVPILYAGDIFHTFNEPAAAINFAITNMPAGYAVPGQHDLEHHRYESIKRSAYWTLVEAGVLSNIEPYERIVLKTGAYVTGFPWGTVLKPCSRKADHIEIALAHKYVWTCRDNSFPDAPKEGLLGAIEKQLKGFTFGVFGDNHQTWFAQSSPTNSTRQRSIVNCGCFIRRTTTEKRYQVPRIYILYEDGTAGHLLLDADTAQERWLDSSVTSQKDTLDVDIESLTDEFQKLTTHSVDFLERLKRVAESTSIKKRTRKLIREIISEFRR